MATNSKSALTSKRIDHFRDILQQICGNNAPSEDIVGKVKYSLNEQNLEYSIVNIKDVLKQLRMLQHYENTQSIYNILNDKSPLSIGDDLQRYLEDRFTDLCNCYAEVAFPRTSFLSYVFVTRKLLELAKQNIDDEVNDQAIQAVPLHVSSKKHEQNMTVWHDVCQKLDWQYIS